MRAENGVFTDYFPQFADFVFDNLVINFYFAKKI